MGGMPPTNIKNTNQLIVWAAVAIVVLVSVWYVFLSGSGGSGLGLPIATTTAPTTTGTQQGTNNPPPARTKQSTAPSKPVTPTSAKVVGVTPVSYLFSLKESLACSFKTTGTSVQRSGTLYIADGAMRANLTNGATMIDDGAHIYLWGTGASKGLELLAASSVSGSAIASNGGFDLATPLSFACNPWKTDSSVFTPPSSVSFSNSL